MVQMWLLWLKHRWRGVSAVGVVLLAVLFAVFIGMGSTGLAVSVLGNVGAQRADTGRPQPGVILPRSSDPGTPIDPAPQTRFSSVLDETQPSVPGAETIADAQKSWTAAEIQHHYNQVLTAFNCMRVGRGEQPFTPDPALSKTAGDAWITLVHNPSWSLMELPGQYALRSVVVLDSGNTASPDATHVQSPAVEQHDSCAVGGFNAATLPAAGSAKRIGIAVFPPQVSWDAPSAVVLVQ